MSKRRKMTDEQIADAKRLKAIFERRQKEARERGERLTQADLGELCEWESGQSAASQYLNGYVPLNIDALLRLSRALNFDPVEVSPTLVAGIESVKPASALGSAAMIGAAAMSGVPFAIPAALAASVLLGKQRSASGAPSNVEGEPIPLKGGLVPVKGKAMLGDDGYFEEMDYPPGAGDGYLQFFSNDQDAYALRVVGSSMEPRIRSGEFVTIEPNQAYMAGDEVLVRTQDGRAMIKVFMYHREGEIRLLSINDAHPPIIIPETSVVLIHPVSAIVKSSRLVEV